MNRNKIKIVFISLTPLAGAPIRIAQALNKYTEYSVRVINKNPNCYGERTFDEDLIWDKDKKECLEVICGAQILHFHHFFNIENDNNPFGINFKQLAPKAKIVRHFHSELNFCNCKNLIINDPYPKLVIPHNPERTFLDAFIVPNIIPINDSVLKPINVNNDILKVFFSASSPYSMWERRWETKGLPEVLRKIKSLSKIKKFDFQVVQNTPYIECQKIKQKSDIIIGDTTSGSYHLTDLEALSQGKPTFTYLDSRTQFTLQNLLQCDELPFINTRLEEIDLPFIELLQNKLLREDIGKFSRYWIEKFYNEQGLVKFYQEAYEKILNDDILKRQNYLEFPKAKNFLYNDLYDLQWKHRKKVNQKKGFLNRKISIQTRKKEVDMKVFIRKIFSVRNEERQNKKYKVISILGIKIKIKIKNTKNTLTQFQQQDKSLQIMQELATKLSMVNNIWQINKTKFYVPNYPIDFIQKSIVNNNKYFEEDILKQLDEYLPKEATILDLGANIGNHTLYWLLSSPKNVRKVYSFEPIKTTFEILSKNIEINNLQSKAALYNIGLYDKDSNGEIAKYSAENIGCTNIKEGEGEIILKKLDGIELNENSIDFMKIDVEGLELQLLNGAKETINKYKPLIFIESWAENYNLMNDFFEMNNYELIRKFPSHNYLYQYKDKNTV